MRMLLKRITPSNSSGKNTGMGGQGDGSVGRMGSLVAVQFRLPAWMLPSSAAEQTAAKHPTSSVPHCSRLPITRRTRDVVVGLDLGDVRVPLQAQAGHKLLGNRLRLGWRWWGEVSTALGTVLGRPRWVINPGKGQLCGAPRSSSHKRLAALRGTCLPVDLGVGAHVGVVVAHRACHLAEQRHGGHLRLKVCGRKRGQVRGQNCGACEG